MAPTDAFPDHFSAVAGEYARYRPRYPEALFDWLADLPARRGRAWDVGTGSGQLAVGLGGRFAEVIATDASGEQLASAEAHPRVRYRRAVAEAAGLEDASVDLVTVAQALHWFDLDRFWPEVRRALAPGGTVAVMVYDLVRVTPAVNAVIDRYYREVVGDYWPPERALVESRYRTLPFPFRRLDAPPFVMRARWPLARLRGYLGTWSAAKRWRDAHAGASPVERIDAELTAAWAGAAARTARWPLTVLAGRAAGPDPG